MENGSVALVLPTFLLLLQNRSSSDTSIPPAAYKMSESATGPSSGGNHAGFHYGLSPAETAAASMVLGALWLVSIFGNSLICLVVHRSRKTKSTINFFVVSMACADLLISVTSAPFVLLQFTYGRWTLGNGLCKLGRYIQYLTPGVQIHVFLSICVDRFCIIAYPLRFPVFRKQAKKIILASWLFDALFALPVLFFNGSNSDDHCNFFLPNSWEGVVYGISQLLVEFVIPAILLIFFYHKIIKYIWRRGTNGTTVRRTMTIIRRTKVKTVKMFLMQSLEFLLSWLPFCVVQLWHPQETDYRKSSLVFLAITCIAFSASASKPILYFIYKASFRRGLKELFCMSAMKYRTSNAHTITSSSRIEKTTYVGIAAIPAPSKTVTSATICDAFNREAKEKELAWPVPFNPPNTFLQLPFKHSCVPPEEGAFSCFSTNVYL